MATEVKSDHEPAEEEAPISVPDSGDTGESGKLKMIVQLVKKCLGVKDIASMRLSLPASLLEPIPNLEYWQYLDRPDLFAAINDSEDAFERMLAVIRFTFTKDLKFIRGRVCKPYNSVLGEHFRSHWDVVPVSYPSDPRGPPVQHLYLAPAAAESSVYSLPGTSATATPAGSTPPSAFASPRVRPSDDVSVRSGKSGTSSFSKGVASPSTAATSVESNLDAQMSTLSLGVGEDEDVVLEAGAPPAADATAERVRIAFLTEQVSHHPPISAYYAVCPPRHVELAGVDQISARVAGTAIKIFPGSFNKGIFVRLTGGPGEGEQYQITHPTAAVNGILRGSFYVTVGDSTIVTCTGGAPGQKLRTILEYKEESWLGKAHFLVEGVVHTYTEGEPGVEEWTKVKHVPKDRAVAYIDGSWRHKVRWRRATASTKSGKATPPQDRDWATLIDLSTLHVVPKSVRPLEKQLPNESRRLWENVTSKLLSKEYSDATKHKHAIEQKQRDDAAERKRKGIEFAPVYFEKEIDSGIPQLTEAGRKAIEEELREGHPEEPSTPKPSS
ncbi:hypothetical protein PUNSTDRAFT_52431 [Punctularia strigosozonata HHB-11173 SS5]|uniref:uncharacterized protein n=1 Tax=Punctularia strigosozonata (strain HHB-11173) TaxID=741275 RepID=UPI0004417B55|nr:uncharacterized protein PUNSTDRAFT_52431 [Punctularia strigosozonata HHB-11173 SS5]EIN09023.1 hypothetical protein PUNSTDRAFT_52431 [Punctularia strigosozonata HHB-11173 SS5]